MTLAFLALGMASIMIATTLYTVKAQATKPRPDFGRIYQPYELRR